MEFERSSRRVIALPLTPLIDVMFILIIFFMLTTSFMRVESLELNLPSVSPKPAEKTDVMHLFIQADGNMLLGKRKLDQQELTESLSRMFRKDPNTKMMLLTAEGVTMQQLVNVMDNIYQVGGRSLFVRKWEEPPADALVKPEDPAVDPSLANAPAPAALPALSPAAGAR
jgi:biopolymer transport protein ExbD